MSTSVLARAALVACASAAPLLWPQPTSLTFGKTPIAFARAANGTFFTSPVDSPLLARAFRRYEALLFPADCPPAALTFLRVDVDDADADLQLGANESYLLRVDATGASVRAATVWGALRALETVSQLAADCAIADAPVVVADTPRFPHRGLMIDSARHFLPVDAVTALIEAMSYSKMNTLHWHLTDHQSLPVVSTAEPLLTNPFDAADACRSPWNPMEAAVACAYSHDDLRDVVAFARDRGVRVVPEIDNPGHAGSWSGVPGLVVNCSDDASPSGVLEITLNATRAVVREFLGEMAAVFPDKHFHLGHDEVGVPCLNASSAAVAAELAARGLAHDVAGVLTLVREWIAFAQAALVALGKTPIAWEEAIDKYGGEFDDKWPPPSAAIDADSLAAGSVVQIWKSPAWYDVETGLVNNINASGVVGRGFGVLKSEGWYLSAGPLTWNETYAQDPATNLTCAYDASTRARNCTCLAEGAADAPQPGQLHPTSLETCYDITRADELARVLGGEGCLWGEHINASNLQTTAWPAALGIAERLWSAREVNDPVAAFPRIDAHVARLRARGVPTGDLTPL